MRCRRLSSAWTGWRQRWYRPAWTMAPLVSAFQAMRGVQFMTAVTVVAEASDLRRFDHPRQLMAFLGLVPSERSTGETRRQGGSPRQATAAPARCLLRRPGPTVTRQVPG